MFQPCSSPELIRNVVVCRYATSTEWLTGSSDGSLALWTQFKKKPVAVLPHAHALPTADASPTAEGNAGVDPRSWIQSVAVAHNSDLAVRAQKLTFFCCCLIRHSMAALH